jgi:hypothetical protein
MHNRTNDWLAGDWLVLGAHIPHWVVAIGMLIVVALLVAWFERPKRVPARSSLRPHTAEHRSAFRSNPSSALD